MCSSSNGYGASQSAPAAATTIPANTQPARITRQGGKRGPGSPWISSNGAAITDLRVEEGVQEVGGEIGEALHRGQHQDRRLYQRQVVAFESVDQEPADARISKNRLNRDNAADQESDILGQHSDRRQQRVAQRMARHHRP